MIIKKIWETDFDTRLIFRRILNMSLSFLFFFICIANVYAVSSFHGFDYTQISRLKAFALVSTLVVGFCVLVLSLNRRTCRYNNIILINLIICIVGVELILRIMDHRLPFGIVEMIPKSDRERIRVELGRFTNQALRGEGMLYSWRSNTKFDALPWVNIDHNGYRNQNSLKSVDIVILGDSVSLAINSKHDLGDILRDKGLSTLNLGLGGYGPFHQRDAYHKHVISAGIEHRVVLINFCYCNDITDAMAYRRIVKKGGDWRNYLTPGPSRMVFPFSFEPPWVVSILFHLPYLLVQKVRDRTREVGDKTSIHLPRGEINLEGWNLPSEPQFLEDKHWEPTLTALSEIIALSNSANAKVILAYYPNLAQIYMPFFPKTKPYREAAQSEHLNSTKRLTELAKKYGAEFVDYTGSIQQANARQRVTAGEMDYHPNLLGVYTMADTIYPVIIKFK